MREWVRKREDSMKEQAPLPNNSLHYQARVTFMKARAGNLEPHNTQKYTPRARAVSN